MPGIELAAGLDLATARARVAAAMAEANTAMSMVRDDLTAAGWLQREDGAWALVDHHGRVHRIFAYGPYEDTDEGDVFADAATAATGEPAIIDVEPLYTPALQRLLEVAERIARDSGATTVDVEHVEQAITGRRQGGGESPGDPAQ